MNWSKSARRASGLLAIVVLAATSLAGAQPEDAGKENLEEALETRAKGNTEAVSVQQRIDQVSDETDDLVARYRTTLKQIDSIGIYNGQMRELIDSQNNELASLQNQLDRVEVVGRSVTPLMLRMIDAIEKFVELDVPFLMGERSVRIEELRKTMSRADVTSAEKFRQIMEAYQIENEYGRTIEAYRDTIEIDGRETTVDFLRFGRIALVYQSLDQTMSGMWDQQSRSWKPLDNSFRSGIRDGLRIARKQMAPDLIQLPLPAAATPRES